MTFYCKIYQFRRFQKFLREYYWYAVSQVHVLVVPNLLTSLQCCQIGCAMID